MDCVFCCRSIQKKPKPQAREKQQICKPSHISFRRRNIRASSKDTNGSFGVIKWNVTDDVTTKNKCCTFRYCVLHCTESPSERDSNTNNFCTCRANPTTNEQQQMKQKTTHQLDIRYTTTLLLKNSGVGVVCAKAKSKFVQKRYEYYNSNYDNN